MQFYIGFPQIWLILHLQAATVLNSGVWDINGIKCIVEPDCSDMFNIDSLFDTLLRKIIWHLKLI